MGEPDLQRKEKRLSPERDLRKYAEVTQRRIFLGFLALLFLVGYGLIFFFYGEEAGVFGLIFTGIGLSPLVLIFAFMKVFGWIGRRGLDD